MVQLKQEEERKRRLQEELRTGAAKEGGDDDEQENKASTYIQKKLRGIIARTRVEQMRQDELVFLGMAPRPKTLEEMKNDPNQKSGKTQNERKKRQEENMDEYERQKNKLKNEIKDNEGPDITETMKEERREWYRDQMRQNGMVPPDALDDFYKRFDVQVPLTPEEIELQKQAEEEASKKKKDKKKEKKDKKGKKGKKKKDDGDEGGKDLYMVGPSEVVRKFDEFYDGYNDEWANAPEENNQDQVFDTEKAKKEIMPDIEEEFKQIVDKMILIELANMKALRGIKSKKKKGKKGKKKGKKGKKKKGKPLPGEKVARKLDVKDLLVELVTQGIAKKLPEQNLTDFIGEYNYLHSMLDDLAKGPWDPSIALIRQIVTEYGIFPLGSELVKQRTKLVRSMLFYGPPGTGKTLVVRAMAYETASIVFDLSPLAIDGKYGEKKGEEKMVASCMIVAEEYQPAIIYIDECEKTFPAKKKGKKGKKKAKKGDPSNPNRIKKALQKWIKGFLKTDKRILIVGCTSEPHEGNKKDLKSMFDIHIYFPFPDYSTRKMMWKQFIQKLGGRIKPDFPLSTLAHISTGYSAGSILKTCEKVLTKHRKSHLDSRPLGLSEFIGPLSLTHNTMNDLYEEYTKFTDHVSGDQKRRDAIEAAKRGDDDGGDDKKKKGKGKKKKK